jgi:hypothetical protein
MISLHLTQNETKAEDIMTFALSNMSSQMTLDEKHHAAHSITHFKTFYHISQIFYDSFDNTVYGSASWSKREMIQFTFYITLRTKEMLQAKQ